MKSKLKYDGERKMKPEPLTREKIGWVVLKEVKGLKILWEESKPKIVSVEDVKNAVEWLLKEIQGMEFEHNENGEILIAKTKNKIIYLIRKAFEGIKND